MKKYYVVLLLFSCFFSLFNVIAGEDQFLDNIYTPTANSQSSPHCIIYNDINNMYYIYTGQKIIVVNKTSGSIEYAIPVGQTGYLAGCKATIEKTHKLAFDHSRNYIYCANEDDELLVINCNSNEVLTGSTLTSLYPLYGSFLYYNPDIDLIYWVQNTAHIDEESYLSAIDPTTMTPMAAFETGNGQRITDFTFNDQNDFLVISTEDYESHSGSLFLFDPADLQNYDEEVFMTRKVKGLLFINEFNRIYCFTRSNSESILEAYTINEETNQLMNLTAFTISDFPLINCRSACYSSADHLAYFAGEESIGYKLVIINYTSTTLPIVEQYLLSEVRQVLYSQYANRVFCAGENLHKIYGSQIEDDISLNGLANHLIETGDQLAVSNIDGSSCQSYSYSLELIHHIQLGDAIQEGILNSTYQKIYWISAKSMNPESFVSIQNLADNSIISVSIGPGITDMDYHNGTEQLVVSNWYGPEHQLTIINGQTNDHQTVPSGVINVLHAGENNSTYLGGGNYLAYIEMTNYSINQITNNLSVPYQIWDFETTANGNCVALALENSIYGCKLIEIDKNNNQVIGTHPFQVIPLENNGLYYNTQKNQLYLLSDISVSIIDASSYSILGTINIPSGNVVESCQYSARQDRLIIIDNPGNSSRILFYDASRFDLLYEIAFATNEIILSAAYNPVNDLLYLHTLRYDWDMTFNNEIRVRSYRVSDFQMDQDIYLEQNHIKNSWVCSQKERMAFDDNGDKLYIPNLGLGNISIIQCASDQILLKPETINWISFPRLDRDNNDPVLAQPVLENIDPFPDHLSMTNLPPQEEEEITIEYTNNQWIVSGLTHIQSTRGYKLETSNTELSFLPMEGTQLDPAYPISIYEGYENWVGYYPTWQQDPFDALADVLDELTLIKHHDWACVKEWGYIPPDGNLKPYWICWNKKPLKYADMVVLETTEDVTFQWGDGASGPNHDMLSTEYFSFDEKPDYTPIFIDLDSTDNPLEIGAFIADSCIGASVVEEGDTLVMIRGYMPDDTAGEITFQEYYGATKSASGSIGDYYVLNTERHVREKRIIHSGENKKYYHVSFKNDNSKVEMINPLILSVYPNPYQDHSRIDYFIPRSSRVKFEIIDVFGRKVSETLTGDMAAGHYTMMLEDMNTNSIPAGIYLVRMSACGNTVIKKILINR